MKFRAQFNVTDFARGLSTDDIRDARTRAVSEIGSETDVLKSRSSRLSQHIAEITVEFETLDDMAALSLASAGARATGLANDHFRIAPIA